MRIEHECFSWVRYVNRAILYIAIRPNEPRQSPFSVQLSKINYESQTKRGSRTFQKLLASQYISQPNLERQALNRQWRERRSVSLTHPSYTFQFRRQFIESKMKFNLNLNAERQERRRKNKLLCAQAHSA